VRGAILEPSEVVAVEGTEMVKGARGRGGEKLGDQGAARDREEATRITGSTPYEFGARGLTPYGGLLPLVRLLERLEFAKLIEERLTIKRQPVAMSVCEFVLAMVIALYIGFDRLSHMAFLARDAVITGILGVKELPVQSTFWRFLNSLKMHNVRQWEQIHAVLLQRVWQAAGLRRRTITIDTDTTVNTVYGRQVGARKSYNPKNRGKRSYQPILSFIAETGEFIFGNQRNGDKPSGEEVARHLQGVFAAIPSGVERVRTRQDAGFYSWEAVAVNEEHGAEYIIVAQKTQALQRKLEEVGWRWDRQAGAEVADFLYEPQGWQGPRRFVAVRTPVEPERAEVEQYQLFETEQYTYRAFVTNWKTSVASVVQGYAGRASAENLIKEANNDAGLASVPGRNFIVNKNFFFLVMLAYNLNRWLMLFAHAGKEPYQRTMLRTARAKYVFVAAKVIRHARRGLIRYSREYEEQGRFHMLMKRLASIRNRGGQFVSSFQFPVEALAGP
jgi:hypothetical protein